MKKTICLVIVLLLCVSMLAGCSKDNPQNKDPQTDAPQTDVPQTDAPQADDPQAEAPVITKTFTLENEKMTAENVSPYEGAFWEDGSAEAVSGVCAVKFTNTSDQTIQDAQLIFSDGTQELSFWLEMLPAGQSVLVCEQNRKAAASEQLQYVDGTVTYLAAGLENTSAITTTSTTAGLVDVENVTEAMLPLVRIFYRSTNQDGTPLGGVCQSVMADGLEANAAVTVEAENWDASSVVVTVLVINE